MSITKKAAIMADEGFASEDIAALLKTTPAVVRTLLHRTQSGGKTLSLRLPDHIMLELEKRAGKSMSAKSFAQIMLVKILKNSEENNESHT